MENHTLSALLFDVDGTLADTERDGHRIAFNAAFQEHGLDWNWDVALYGKLLEVTGGKERIRHFVDHFLPDYAPPKDFGDLVTLLHRSKPGITPTCLNTVAFLCDQVLRGCWTKRVQPACAWPLPPPPRRKTSPRCCATA